jgi:hypothetical protein
MGVGQMHDSTRWTCMFKRMTSDYLQVIRFLDIICEVKIGILSKITGSAQIYSMTLSYQ